MLFGFENDRDEKAALDETLLHRDNKKSIRAVPTEIFDLEQLKISLASL